MKRLLFALAVTVPALLLAQNPNQATGSGASPGSSSSSGKIAVSIEFVKIAPGEFMMGCAAGDAACDPDEKPLHRVQITKAFEIGKYEVTQAQWMAVMGSNPSTHQGAEYPVETISKEEAQQFLDKLNAQNDGYHYRLPSEAEWEYAARAGAPPPASLDDVAWYAGNSGDQSHPVGQKKPNAWGIYDTLGNVREWVADQYAMNYYSVSPVADPTGPLPGQGGQGQRGFGRGRRFGQPGGGPPGGGPGGQPNSGPPSGTANSLQISYRIPGPQAPQGQQPGAGQAPQGGGQGQQGGQGGFGRGNFGGGGRGGGGGGRQLPIMRGGAWDNPANFVRLSARYHYYGPTLKLSDLGFRAVREPIQNEGGQ